MSMTDISINAQKWLDGLNAEAVAVSRFIQAQDKMIGQLREALTVANTEKMHERCKAVDLAQKLRASEKSVELLGRQLAQPRVEASSGKDFATAFERKQRRAHDIAVSAGWWEEDRNNFELLSLVHAEVSEIVEQYRVDPAAKSEKVPDYLAVTEEMADVIIRLMDMAQMRGYALGDAVEAKIEFNATRPHRHGGKLA